MAALSRHKPAARRLNRHHDEKGLNIYGYANGDPVNNTDPSGLDPSTGGVVQGGVGTDIIVTGSQTYYYGWWYDLASLYNPSRGTFSSGGSGNGGSGIVAKPAQQSMKSKNHQCINADSTVSGSNTGSNWPGLGNVWAVGGGVQAAAGGGGGVERGTWYDRSTGAHGGFMTTYYMVGTPGGGAVGALTNFSDLASFTGWSTGLSGAGALIGGSGSQSSSGGWGHSLGAGFRTPQLCGFKSYTTITSGLPRC